MHFNIISRCINLKEGHSSQEVCFYFIKMGVQEKKGGWCSQEYPFPASETVSSASGKRVLPFSSEINGIESFAEIVVLEDQELSSLSELCYVGDMVVVIGERFVCNDLLHTFIFRRRVIEFWYLFS